jgi:Berberine and berberine like/FAD binding domain
MAVDPSADGGDAATSSSTQLHALRKQIQGRVLVPGDDGYDAARQTWNVATFEQRPAIVVLPLSVEDVVSAVAFVRERGLSIGEQSGGHRHPRPVNGALLLNFADMAAVRVTPPNGASRRGTADVQAGAKWRDVIATGERLINSLDARDTGPHLVRAYSARNYDKLLLLKHKYDPQNVFRFNHNIAPAD